MSRFRAEPPDRAAARRGWCGGSEIRTIISAGLGADF